MKLNRLIGIALICGYFLYCGFTPTEWHFIDNVNLIFHEAGHTIFMFFGDFIHVAMGSGFQILLPLLISVYFYFNDQKTSAAITLGWVGQNLVNVSVYARDAIAMELPLLGGDGVMHDWNYLLNELHVLKYTPVIAHTIYGLGMTIIFSSLLLALFFNYHSQETDLESK
jgi:hypothetical protein